MKTLLLPLLALGFVFTACDSKQENQREAALERKADAMEDQGDAVKKDANAKADAVDKATDKAPNATEKAGDAQADAIKKDGEAKKDGLEKAAEATREQK